MPIYTLELCKFFGRVLLSSTGWVCKQAAATERSAGPLSWLRSAARVPLPHRLFDEI